MRGYVERMEFLQQFHDEPIGYDKVMGSYREQLDDVTIDAPRPSRGLCRRCGRTRPTADLVNTRCVDRRDCSVTMMRSHKRRQEGAL